MELDFGFTEEDMVVNETLGYPKAFAKLCRDRSVVSYSNGPPFTFTPYSLQQDEAQRAEEFEQMFPVLDPKARATAKAKIFLSLLWKQLSHLGNAGFDPAVIRVDPYGNVLYYHADSASPLAWEIDHWFPCSRGGLTVPSNLRILQWQACKKKHNKLEFLIPWWDFQLGISVNQFLSVFASSNSDFRHRAFSFLFAEGENEEVNEAQTVQSHSFPHHFVESKEKVGLAPAAIVLSQRESRSTTPLRAMDYNSQLRAHQIIPLVAARKVRPGHLKENENPNQVLNPYQAIFMARDSLKQREEKAKIQVELEELDNEVATMKRKNEDEKIAIQDLELTLVKRRRRAEKCRRLAEAQSSYRTMLEKMIRDAMHQSVIYKEQVRLNQAATNALMARLEAQKAICDASEKELHKIHKQKDEIQTQIRPEWEQARKRSRMDDTLIIDEHQEKEPILCLPGIRPRTPLHKELRVFLEEEHQAAGAQLNLKEQSKNKGPEVQQLLVDKIEEEEPENHGCQKVEVSTESKIESLHGREGQKHKITFPIMKEMEREEDGESRKLRGKENVERWLQMLLENAPDDHDEEKNQAETTDDIIRKLNNKYPQKETEKLSGVEETGKLSGMEDKKGAEKSHAVQQEKNAQEQITKEDILKPELANSPTVRDKSSGRDDAVLEGRKSESFEPKEKGGKEKGLVRSESARLLRRIPSSPLLVVKKGVDCIRKKPLVIGDDDDDYYGHDNVGGNSFIRTSFKTIKKAVKM